MLTIYFKTDDWHEMDFNDFDVAMNDTIQNIHNPVKMNTEYSKTISLPLTAKNREIIQHYNRLDSLITTAFDPTKAIPARLEVDGNIIFEGSYAVTKIDLSKNRIEGNFYSTINTWINRLKRITWDDLPNCLPDGFSIDKEKVYESWMALPGLRSTNFNLPDALHHYRWTDWIGFAPTITGELSDFSCDAMFKSDNTAITYHPWEVFTMGGGDAGLSILKTIIPKPTERQMLQYRSYYQKPYMYVDNLFKLIQHYCNLQDDLPYLDIDEEWTTEDNPNWRNLIYFLPNMIKSDDKATNSTMVYNINNPLQFNNSGFQLTRGNTWTVKNSNLFSLVSPDDPNHDIIDSDGWIIGNGKSIDYILPINFNLNFSFWAQNAYNDDGGLHGWNKKMRLNGQIILQVELVDQNGTVLAGSTKNIYSIANSNGWDAPNFQTTVTTRPGGSGQTTYDISWSIQGSGVYSHAFVATANTKYKPRYKWNFKNGFTQWTGVDSYATAYVLFTPNISGMEQYDYYYIEDMLIPAWEYHNNVAFTTASENTNTDIHRLRFANPGRSGREFTMKDLWGTEENNTPFMVFLKYIKMFNLAIIYDNYDDTIKVMPKEKFFEQGYNNGIEDWTNKVDFGRDMSFTPLSWEDKYIEFNYADFDLSKIKTFKDKYGFNYGTKRISTSYSFNNETKELLEDADSINASGEMSEYMFNMYQLNRIASNPTATVQLEETFLTAESYMINTKDDKMADMHNCFAYRWDDNTDWDRNVNRLANGVYHGYMYITDDCQFENNNGSFNYQPTLSGNISWNNNKCTEYYCNALRCGLTDTKPRISHYITKTYEIDGEYYANDYCCLFSVPREDYFNPAVVQRNNKDLWTTRWSNLITEMYSMQNKLLTCYIYLTPEDYNNFKFNKFIIIDDVLYLVNKIVDYNPASLKATKCELIQVNDPGAYTTAPINESREIEDDDPWRLVPGWFKKGNNTPVDVKYKGITGEDTTFYIENTYSLSSTRRVVIHIKKDDKKSPDVHIYTSTDNETWTLSSVTPTTTEQTLATLENRGDKLYIKLDITENWYSSLDGYHGYTINSTSTAATNVSTAYNVPYGVTYTSD